jgi:hypothetical protein
MLCGISFGFPELFPIEGQIAHVLRTRAPCAIPYCYGTRTRLACVKHAASVRSEPGSNSRLKLVAWRKKMLRFASEPAYQANYCRSNLLRPFALENSNGFEQILAHRIGCQRAKPPCLAERHSYSPRSISEGTKIVNPPFTISTAILSWTATRLRRGTMRQKSL